MKVIYKDVSKHSQLSRNSLSLSLALSLTNPKTRTLTGPCEHPPLVWTQTPHGHAQHMITHAHPHTCTHAQRHAHEHTPAHTCTHPHTHTHAHEHSLAHTLALPLSFFFPKIERKKANKGIFQFLRRATLHFSLEAKKSSKAFLARKKLDLN